MSECGLEWIQSALIQYFEPAQEVSGFALAPTPVKCEVAPVPFQSLMAKVHFVAISYLIQGHN